MSDELVSTIYNLLSKFKDPVSETFFNKNNQNITILSRNGNINITINIDPKFQTKYENLIIKIKESVQKIQEVNSVNVILTSEKQLNKESNTQSSFRVDANNIIAIASGKGGVGKSTFAVNFAVALNLLGFRVGILDADVYGPSVPRMMGISRKPELDENKKLLPLVNYGIKCMSIGFLIDVDTPAIWRGPMVMKALEQMFNGVMWDSLDYLIIDLPPGTGDAQLTLAQKSKLNGAIIISTPQDVALIDARKGINMFKKVNVPVLGIVENMSYFICNNCNQRHEIFSYGGAKKESEKYKTNFLGELPIDINLRINSDEGKPICISNSESNIAKKYLDIARKISSLAN